jgi:hypothetical protein
MEDSSKKNTNFYEKSNENDDYGSLTRRKNLSQDAKQRFVNNKESPY